MEISALQKARYEYAPKLPGMLRHGIADICVKEGEETQSVADQEKIKALFPNTYGKKEITFQKGANTSVAKKQVVGVILSGGQAPGGHNVICGLYDALKATNPENVLYGFKNGPSGLIEDDYLVFDDEHYLHALGTMLMTVVLIILVFTYYISVAKDLDFKKRFWEMALISLSVAAFSFVIGLLVKEALGIDI